VELVAWGWYPAGQGEITMEVAGQNIGGKNMASQNIGDTPSANKTDISRTVAPTQWLHRGDLQQVTGTAVASSLPAHIAQRMSNHATRLLEKTGITTSIKPQRVRSVSPGAGIFLTAEYESGRAGFSAIGKKGKPSEQVAEEVVEALLAFHQTEAAVDTHLTDQLILPLAVSGYAGKLLSEKLSKHTLTNIWAAEQFLGHIATVNHNNNTIQFHTSR
jgi:RNA 3'-terminal phosphate cyclase (ATP)